MDAWLETDASDPRPIIQARIELLQSRPEIGRLLSWASLTAVPFPEPILARRERILQRVGAGNHAKLLHFLFAIAATDGWFLFRNLYRNLAGDAVLEDAVSQELLRSVLANFDS